MIKDMDLSIIIPAYKAEKWIRRCLDSVVVATKGYENRVEVIVVDDSSPDGTLDICNEYNNRPNWKILNHNYNQGVSQARNTGLNNATGRWIAFLDCDDVFNPDGVTVLLNASQSYYNYNIIQFNHRRYYKEKDKFVVKYYAGPGSYTYVGKGLSGLPPAWWGVWNKLYSHKFLKENNLSYEVGLDFGEDERFNLECLRVYPHIYCIDSVAITRHFDNKESLSHTVTAYKLIEQSTTLCDLLRISDAKKESEFTNLIRDLLADHWASNTYFMVFGGKWG